MNETLLCYRSYSWWLGGLTALILLAHGPLTRVEAQPVPGMAPMYAPGPQMVVPGGPLPPGQLPTPSQYYEFVPDPRRVDNRFESPLDRFLKQSIQQTYGKFEYLHWAVSNPGEGVIGGPGKKLLDGEGFQRPTYIDPVRGPQVFDATPSPFYPVRLPLLTEYPQPLVLIQVWESTPNALPDDDNDLDIFQRISNDAKNDILTGTNFDVLYTSGLNNPLADTVPPDLSTAAQVAVLTVGQLANTNVIELDDTNGFRGQFGLNTNFGALEMNFFALDSATSGTEFRIISSGFLTPPGLIGGGTAPADPLVIPILVNDQVAPDIFDADGNIVTDSNNYYLIFNDAYNVTYRSDTWGVSPTVLWTLNENPGRFKISSSFGFRYFDFQEQMRQQGTFSTDPAVADFTYETENGTDLTTVIDSNTVNKVYGPQAGLRAELGDERVSFGVDANVMLGANTHEATVNVSDVLFAGDNNFTRDASTHFTTGFETTIDARVRVTNHVTLSLGYNFMWFNSVTRPHNNIYYNIDATPVVAPPATGPDFVFNNDIVVNKQKQAVSLSGLSVGILVDW